MDGGTQELARTATAYLAGIAFSIAFLVTTFAGGSGLTAVGRGAVAALATWTLGRPLASAALATVLDAMARDQAKSQKEGNE